MFYDKNIKCIGFSYAEVEDIIHQWDEQAEPAYEGAIVRAYVDDEPYDFAEILSQIKSELNISPTAIAIYCEIGYVYTRRGIDVIVINGIQEGADNE